MARQLRNILDLIQDAFFLKGCSAKQAKEVNKQIDSGTLPNAQHNHRPEHSTAQQENQLQEVFEEFNDLFTKCQNEIHGLDGKKQVLQNNIDIDIVDYALNNR